MPHRRIVRGALVALALAYGPRARSAVQLDSIAGLLRDVEAGLISSYSDVLAYRR